MQGRTGEVEPLEGVVQVAASLAPAPRVVVQVTNRSTAAGHVTTSSPLIGAGGAAAEVRPRGRGADGAPVLQRDGAGQQVTRGD